MASKKQAPKKNAPAKKVLSKSETTSASRIKEVTSSGKKAVAKAPAKKAAAPTPKPSLTQQSKDENRQAFLDKGFTPEEIDKYPVNFMKKAVRSTRSPYDWVQPNAYRGGV